MNKPQTRFEKAMAKVRQGYICPKCDCFYDGPEQYDKSAPPCPDCFLAHELLGHGERADFIQDWLDRRLKMVVQESVKATIAELKERGR